MVKENNRLYLSTRCTNEYGESPSYAQVELTPALLERVHTQRALIALHGLMSITSRADVRWGNSDKLRLDGDEMTVGQSGFWFQVYVKHQDGHVETEALPFELLTQFASGEQKVVYFDGRDTVIDATAQRHIHYQKTMDEPGQSRHSVNAEIRRVLTAKGFTEVVHAWRLLEVEPARSNDPKLSANTRNDAN